MKRAEAINLLPEPYAEALRLQEAGLGDTIPERLGIPPESVSTLLRLARAKLAALLDTSPETET